MGNFSSFCTPKKFLEKGYSVTNSLIFGKAFIPKKKKKKKLYLGIAKNCLNCLQYERVLLKKEKQFIEYHKIW
jgi:hypothetical protein